MDGRQHFQYGGELPPDPSEPLPPNPDEAAYSVPLPKYGEERQLTEAAPPPPSPAPQPASHEEIPPPPPPPRGWTVPQGPGPGNAPAGEVPPPPPLPKGAVSNDWDHPFPVQTQQDFDRAPPGMYLKNLDK